MAFSSRVRSLSAALVGAAVLAAAPADAENLNAAAVNGMLSGATSSLWLGNISGQGNTSGKDESVTKQIEGPNGERATLNVEARADGTVSSSLVSNVNVPTLGTIAGRKVTFTSKSLCPDPDGKVHFSIKTEDGNGQAEAEVTLTVNDNAQIADREINTKYNRTTGANGTANWRMQGANAPELIDQTSPGSGAGQAEAATYALALGISAATGAEQYWNSGQCIRIEAKTPYRPAPGGKSDIPVSVIHKLDGGQVPARVDATLEGGASLNPVVIRRAPGTLLHVAPDKKNVQMTLKLSAVSRRGRANETYHFSTYAEQAYRAHGGGGGDPIDQVTCSINDRNVLNGKLFGWELDGGYDSTWKMVRHPPGPAKWRANGTYSIKFPDGEDKPGTLTITGSSDVNYHVKASARTTQVNATLTLTPVDSCEQAKPAAPAGSTRARK